MSRHLMERNLRQKSKHLKSNEVDLLPSHGPEYSQHIGIKQFSSVQFISHDIDVTKCSEVYT